MELKLFWWQIEDGMANHVGLVWAMNEEEAKAAGLALCEQMFMLTDRGYGPYAKETARASLFSIEQGGPAALITTFDYRDN